MIDSVYDGTSFAVARVEDNNYELSLEVLGNEERNNTGCDPVIKTFNTFAVAFATIPSGSDLCEYFQNNPIPEGNEEELVYDLEEGASIQFQEFLTLAETRYSCAVQTTRRDLTIHLYEKS